MLVDLGGKASNRKLRLFAAACCRQEWHRLTDWRCRRAVELAESVADAKASEAELLEVSGLIQSGRRASVSSLVTAACKNPPTTAAFDTVITAMRLAALRKQRAS